MIPFLKLLLYALFLYLLRLYGIGWIEQQTLFEPMHAPMTAYADCFGFTMADLPLSHLFNYLLWFSTLLIFHLAQRAMAFHIMIRSLLIFGLVCLFHVSLTGAYMNHFNEGIRVFFRYAMLDALLIFGILGLLNGLAYPLLFKREMAVD